MDYLKLIDIQNKLSKIQKPSRFNHTLGVMYTSAALAMKYGTDLLTAQTAGLLHDCAKTVSNEIIAKECDMLGISLTEFERENPHLIHGKLGAYYSKSLYDVTDPEICRAIEHHTRGRAGMSVLEQTVFIADFIEPNRKPFEGLEVIRKTAFEDPDLCTLLIYEAVFKYLKETGRPIDTTSEEAYNYYKKLVTEKGVSR